MPNYIRVESLQEFPIPYRVNQNAEEILMFEDDQRDPSLRGIFSSAMLTDNPLDQKKRSDRAKRYVILSQDKQLNDKNLSAACVPYILGLPDIFPLLDKLSDDSYARLLREEYIRRLNYALAVANDGNIPPYSALNNHEYCTFLGIPSFRDRIMVWNPFGLHQLEIMDENDEPITIPVRLNKFLYGGIWKPSDKATTEDNILFERNKFSSIPVQASLQRNPSLVDNSTYSDIKVNGESHSPESLAYLAAVFHLDTRVA